MKKLAASLIGLVVVLTGISLAPQFLIDQNHLRERVTAVFQAQTGLELKMGETSFQLLPWPSFQATNVVLTRPGCSPFVVARSVHADMSLFALLNREVSFQDFTVDGAGVIVHRAREGQCSTWLPVLTQSQGEAASSPIAVAGRVHPRWKVSFGALHLKNATLSWQDDVSVGEVPFTGRIQITRLELDGMRSASPWVDMSGQSEHTVFTARGRIGPLARLLSAKAEQKGPWPFSLGMTLGSGPQQDHATLDGAMSDAHRLQGLAFTLEGHWASLKGLHRFFPQFFPVEIEQLDGTLRLHAVDAPHKAADAGLDKGADVALTDALLHVPERLRPDVIHLHLGHVVAPMGLQLRDVQLDADNGQAPLIVQSKAIWGRYAWRLNGEVQSLQQAVAAGLPDESAPVMVKMEVQGQDKTLASLFNQNEAEKSDAAQEHVSFALQGQMGRKGSILDVSGQAGLLQLPDWGVFSGLLLHDMHLKGQLALGAIGEAGLPAVTARDVVLESQEIGGTATMTLPAPLGAAGLTGQIHLTHLDGTRFRYAPVMEFAGSAAEPSVPTLSLGAALKTVEPPAAPSTESRSAGDRYVGAQYAGSHDREVEANPPGDNALGVALANVPGHDGPLARWLGALAVQPLDIDFTADHLQSTEVEYQGLHLHLLGHEGHVVLSVLGGAVQTVPLSGEIVLDGSTEPLRMGIKADPLILPARWVQLALNQPVTVEGPIQLVGALGTEGAHPSDLLQAIEGQMGLSIVDGRIHREVLAPLAGPAARLLKLGDGTMGLRCAAGVVQFNHGQVHFGDMALEVKHLSVLGQGSMALADQSYTLQLMPHVSVIGADFSTPLLLEGKGGSVHIGTAGKDGVPALPPLDTAKFGDDACAYAVQQARAGRQGLPLPEREQDHGGGAGGILRALGLGGH